jgi:ribosomal protein S18 acetylase RimI-like enzyme
MAYSLRLATPADTDAIVAVVNAAFRVEAFFIQGGRINAERMGDLFQEGIFIVAESDEDKRIAAAVYLELRGERAYFGMLSVDPACQGQGLAKRLVTTVENLARKSGAKFMDISVVNLRTELPPLYRKLGYAETGTEPPHPTMIPKLTQPVHLITMSKTL